MWRDWFAVLRLEFQLDNLGPWAVGASLAAAEGHAISIRWLALGTVMLLLSQAALELCDGYYDYVQGAHGRKDGGPTWTGGSGVLAEGRLAPEKVRFLAFTLGALAAIIFAVLTILRTKGGGLAVGAVGAACGAFWAMPPFKLSYRGLGEIVQGIVVGPLMAAEAWVIATGELDATPFLVGIPFGLVEIGMGLAHNIVDAEADARVGKRTLVVRVGVKRAARLHAFVMTLAVASVVALVVHGTLPRSALLAAAATALVAWPAVRLVSRAPTSDVAHARLGREFPAFRVMILLSIGLLAVLAHEAPHPRPLLALFAVAAAVPTWVALRKGTTRTIYDVAAPVYNAVSSLLLFERRVRAAALASLAAPLGGCVLDVGCGTGFHFPALSRQLGREGLVLGIDPSATSLRVAERRAHRCDLSFVAIKGDGAYGAVPVADVDGVIAVFSLSVMPHWREAVARAAALLRPGGRFVVLEQDLQKEGRIGIVRPLLVVVNRFLGASLDRDYARALSAAGLQVRTERHGPYVVITGDKLFPSSSPGERRGSLHLLVEDHDAVERGTPGAPRECEGPQVRRHAAEDRTARAVAARVHPVDRPVGANVELDAHDDLEGATGRETRVRDRLPGGPEHGIDGRVREWLSASADDGDPHERSEHRRAIHAVTLSKTVYLTYLAEKNGAPNESARTMSLREEAFGRILSVRPEGIIAAAPRTRAACDVLERLVSAEAWGVALGIKGDDDRFDPLYFIAREEAYHVRIGDALLALFGRTRVAKRPSLVSRLAVRAMSVLPAYLADILVYLAERFGAGVFAELMSAILTQLPSLHRAYAEALFETLLRDEAEHAAWALRRLGPRQRWIARAARPVFFWFATREAYRGEVKAHPQAGVAP